MWKTIDKVIAVFGILVFIAFMVRHGHMDFSGVDYVAQKTKDAIQSEQGQEIISEVKDISWDLALQIKDEVKKLITDAKESGDRIDARLLRVVDGDTLVVNIEDDEVRIRLIGIDTPESVHEDEEKNTVYGAYASDHTKDLLEDVDTVYLEFDEELEDSYGRLLAYVWLSPKCAKTTENVERYMLNGMVLKDGYAKDLKIAPNDRYSTSFMLIRKDAQKEQRGLWSDSGFVALWE